MTMFINLVNIRRRRRRQEIRAGQHTPAEVRAGTQPLPLDLWDWLLSVAGPDGALVLSAIMSGYTYAEAGSAVGWCERTVRNRIRALRSRVVTRR